MRWRFHPPLIVLSFLLSLPSFPVAAQDAEPEQIGLDAEKKEVLHREEPAFRFRFPKQKKFQSLRERWRIVDLDERFKVRQERIEEELAKEEVKQPKDEKKIANLRGQITRLRGEMEKRKLQLEVAGHPEEYVYVDVVRATVDRKLEDVIAPNADGIQRDWGDVKLILDQDISTKRDLKRRRGHHRLEVTGTPPNSNQKIYLRQHTLLIPARKGGSNYVLVYRHILPAEKYNEDTAGEAEILFLSLQVP